MLAEGRRLTGDLGGLASTHEFADARPGLCDWATGCAGTLAAGRGRLPAACGWQSACCWVCPTRRMAVFLLGWHDRVESMFLQGQSPLSPLSALALTRQGSPVDSCCDLPDRFSNEPAWLTHRSGWRCVAGLRVLRQNGRASLVPSRVTQEGGADHLVPSSTKRMQEDDGNAAVRVQFRHSRRRKPADDKPQEEKSDEDKKKEEEKPKEEETKTVKRSATPDFKPDPNELKVQPEERQGAIQFFRPALEGRPAMVCRRRQGEL